MTEKIQQNEVSGFQIFQKQKSEQHCTHCKSLIMVTQEDLKILRLFKNVFSSIPLMTSLHKQQRT